MNRAPKIQPKGRTADIVDFDEAMLDALTPEVRANALAEAKLLVRAFAPGAAAGELEAMARALSSGARDREMDRRHARRLAAALRRLAKQV